MSVILPNKLIFVAHPRTGSTSVREALVELGGVKVRHHCLMKEISEATGGELSFTVVRNPYDLMATWFQLNPQWHDFEAFLLDYSHSEMIKNGKLFYHEDDVDEVLSYERLDDELNKVLDMVGLGPVKLKRLNITKYKNNYRDYYNDMTKIIVDQMFSKEIQRYGYFF